MSELIYGVEISDDLFPRMDYGRFTEFVAPDGKEYDSLEDLITEVALNDLPGYVCKYSSITKIVIGKLIHLPNDGTNLKFIKDIPVDEIKADIDSAITDMEKQYGHGLYSKPVYDLYLI